jgi:hypothetical protein
MDMLVAFIFGVMAMYLYRQFRPEPIFRQDIADVCVAQLVEGMANDWRQLEFPADDN